jgi:Domain of unknown function (DUF4394)
MSTPTARPPSARPRLAAGAAAAGLALLVGCATGPTETPGPLRPETVVAVTDAAELIRFNAGQPQRVLQRQPLKGLEAGDRLVGIDYRVARGVLYALSARGKLYTLNPDTAQLVQVGTGAGVALTGGQVGFDFNPVVDRVRVVSDSGQNLRLHPDTGALVAADPGVTGPDGAAGAVRLAGAAYTYNTRDSALTTMYVIDLASGALLLQGSREGVTPVVSPNTGRLSVVGPLGTGPLQGADFDIADIHNAALAALRVGGRTRLHAIDLASGRATAIGTVGDGRALWGMAIVP